MKKNSKNFHLNIKQETYQILQKQANLNNQSMTKYIESLIIKKEKFNPQIIKTINQSCYILNTNITNYNALNSAISNLNQLMYFLNINEIPKKEEIISVVKNVKDSVKENATNTNNIIETLKPFVNIKIKKHKRKSAKNENEE